MATMSTYTFTQEELNDHNQRLLTIGKDLIFKSLINNQIGDKQTLNEFNAKYQFVLYKPKWYKKYWRAINGKKDSEDSFHVKLLPILTDEEVLEVLTLSDDDE